MRVQRVCLDLIVNMSNVIDIAAFNNAIYALYDKVAMLEL